MNLKLILLLATATSVMGKNVINIDLLQEGVSDERLAGRDAKNVIHLGETKENDKRDARNVANLQGLKEALEHEQASSKSKRKNVAEIHDSEDFVEQRDDESSIHKRKNIANLVQYITKEKRRYVVDLSKLQEGRVKRSDQAYLTFNEEDCHANVLQTMLAQVPSISIFSGYIREIQEINDKTSLINETMLVVAPSNEAITEKLGGLKPWEFPQSLDNAANEGEVVHANIKNFVDGHVVVNFEQNLLLDGGEVVTKLNNGKLIAIVQKVDGAFEIKVDGALLPVEEAKQVNNGFIFIVGDVLVKPESK